MTPSATPTRPRIEQIDALRAVAALLVLVNHAAAVFLPAALAAGSSTWLHGAAHAIDFGRIGVILFFIISGYVVAHTLGNPATTVGTFAVRRFFRLYPLYWLSIAGACIWLVPGPADVARIAANATMLPTLFGAEPYMGLYWTLESELVFYALATGLLLAGLLGRGAFLVAAVCALIALFAAMMFGLVPAPANLAWKAFPLNLCFMLVGMLAHGWSVAVEGRGRRLVWLGIAIAVALAPSAYSLLRYLASGSADDLRWGVAYPAAVALFFAVFGSRMPLLRPLARVGLVSYSIYLLHPFALMLLDGGLLHSRTVVAALGMTGAVAAAALLTVAMSAASYAIVEAPFNALARRLTLRA